MRWFVAAGEAFADLPAAADERHPEGVPFRLALQHGSMSVEAFAPLIEDRQEPHEQDELYVVRSGRSGFVRDGERIECEQGDVILVPAGMRHRFVDFSEDFQTWVIFWGPSGGEAS
jgi:mannose-6-phosphate isomerase-like protein (cupin superfamily)